MTLEDATTQIEQRGFSLTSTIITRVGECRTLSRGRERIDIYADGQWSYVGESRGWNGRFFHTLFRRLM